MKLIDTDKIHRSRAKITEGSKSFYKEWFSASAIDNAPTVEAIPVEYIKAFKEEVRDVTNGKAVIERLLENWEKENENR